jgi:DNA-binding transcriptional LysR family regulator
VALEDEIGEKLIRRLARSTPLTEKGRVIAALALEMEVRARKIDRIVNLTEGVVSGIVRLTAPPALLIETLIPYMASIGRAHPDLQLVLVADTQFTSLDRGEADIAVRLVKPTGKSNITRKLGTISYSLYGTPDYVNRAPNALHFIGFESSLANTPQQKWLNAFAADRPFRVLSNNLHVQMAAAEFGLGLALLPDRIANQSKLLVRASNRTPPVRTAWLVIHQDVASAPAIRIVADAIVGAFQ